MSLIHVPVINETPNTADASFISEYAVSFEAANPDGVPANCSPGGPGVLGGPEYVNLLQRANPSTDQVGYTSQTFELAAYPDHTFISFKNFTTGVKNVVAFLKGVATIPDALITTFVITASGGAAEATLTATVPVVANAVSYVWTGTAIGEETSVVTGVSVNTLTYVATASTGSKTLICTITTELGQVLASTTKNVTIT